MDECKLLLGGGGDRGVDSLYEQTVRGGGGGGTGGEGVGGRGLHSSTFQLNMSRC